MQTQLVSSRICEPEPPCATCRGEPTFCTDCIQGTYLLGNECVTCNYPCVGCINAYSCFKCDEGYYLVTGTVDECLPCKYPCLTCYQPTFCTSCGWSPEKRNDDRYCRCKSGHFEFGQVCEQCTPPCIKCSGLDNCFNCDNANTGLFLKNGICVPCVYPCMTCLSQTFCINCGYDVEKRVPDSSCRCNDGWWDDGQECRACVPPCNRCTSDTFCLYCTNEVTGLFANDEGLCEKCWYPCVTCTTNVDCLSCGWEPELRNVDWNCNCGVGYYECGTKCKPCIPPCKQCTSETNCIDCNNVDSGTFYFIDYCRPCEYPCATCSAIDSCLTCGFGPERREQSTTCPCKKGYYEVGYQCALCVLPCIYCDSPTICYDCNHGVSGYYKNDENRCVRCPYPCENCSSPNHCFTCLPYLTNRVTDDPTCPCQRGWFESERECLTCRPPCRQCKGLSVECLTCIEGSYFIDGEYLCKYCVYPCITCTSKTECITCGWGIELRNQPNITGTYEYLGETRYHYDDQSCPCKNGYYLHDKTCLPCVLPCVTCTDQVTCIQMDCEIDVSGTYLDGGQCKPCQYPCKTCQNAPYQNRCLSCGYDAHLRDLDNYNCDCKDGYYNQYPENICLPCLAPCTKCTAANACTEFDCQSSISGMYYDTITKQCEYCQYPCKTCTNATHCLQCGWDVDDRNSNPSCACKSGYYQDGQECFKCVRPCLTCRSQTECLTIHCNSHVSPVTGESLMTGMMHVGVTSCQKCNYPCLTCTGNPSHCRSCGFGGHSVRVQPVQRCRRYSCYWEQDCNCKDGYYHRAETQECLPCPYPCTQCSSQTVCLNNYRSTVYHNYCERDNSQLYLSSINPATCTPCTYPCKTCWSTGRYCLTCGYGAEKRQPFYTTGSRYRGNYQWHGYCYCLPGFYEENQECKPCQRPCTQCTSLTVCTEIDDCDRDFSGLWPDTNDLLCKKCEYPCKLCHSPTHCIMCGYGPENRLNAPNCGCKSGFYDNGAHECLPCVLPCLTCQSETVCDTIYDCDYETSGYYPEDLICKQCEYPCVTCTSSTICLTCGWDVENRNAPSHTLSCQCKLGFFDKDQQCMQCQNPCETCIDEETCITIYDCDNLTSGSYSDPISATCVDCPYPCLTCSAPGVCHTCDGNLLNRKASPECTCEDGFYNRVDECIRCPLPCSQCTDEYTCTEYFNCDYHISSQYKSELSCFDCQYPCIQCSSKTSCHICDTELERRHDNSSCNCKDGYYNDSTDSKCKLCRLPCLTCTGPEIGECTSLYSCDPGYFRNPTNVYKTCSPCSYPCRTCEVKSTQCTSCGYMGHLRENRWDSWDGIIAAQQTYCICKHGYYHHAQDKACYPCNYPCLRCWDANTCRASRNNAYVDRTCDTANTRLYYINDICFSCQYPCQTCKENSTSCETCGWGPDRREPVRRYYDYEDDVYKWDRSCRCKKGFFHNIDQKECQSCIAPCTVCSSATNCLEFECNNEVSGQFFNHASDICEDCIFPCKNCEYNGRNCIACASDAENRTDPPYCECKPGFYPKGNICIRCKLPCSTCTGEKECIDYNCQSNISGMYLFTPPNSGQWNDPACQEMEDDQTRAFHGCIFFRPSCKRCEYPCETCTSAIDCLTCGYTGISRNDNTCGCKIGFSLYNEIECIMDGCNSPCATCGPGGTDDCTNCIDGTFLMGNMCSPCPPSLNCLTCSGFETCTSCGDEYYLDEEGMCLPCQYPYIKCKTSTFCLECGYDKEYRLDVPSCTCLSDFYDSGAGCLKCTAPCETCYSPSQTDCISCIKGYYIVGKNCNFCPEACSDCSDPINCSECADGYFLSDTSCLPCQYPCETCQDEVFCYTCGYNPERRFRPPECNCDYLNDYWENGLNQCSKCDDPCRTCDLDTGVCMSCIYDHYFVEDGSILQRFVPNWDGEVVQQMDVDGEMTDVRGFMVDYIYYGDCHACMEGCKKCDVQNVCIVCHEGYYKQDDICIVCKSPCQTCLSDTQCLTCGFGEQLRYHTPGCKCRERNSLGIRISDHGDKCDICSSPCLTCSGPSTSDCTSCLDKYYLDTVTNECFECHESCYQCSGPNQEDCIFENKYKCNEGYYPNGSISEPCKPCVYPCATCISETYCLTCGNDTERRHNAPDCRCFDQYTDDSTNKRCNACYHPCRTCNSDFQNDCITCEHGYFLESDGVTCTICNDECTRCEGSGDNCSQCADDQYLDGNTCIQCVYPCLTCYDSDKCYTCGYNSARRYDGPTCACKEEYSEIGQDCVECLSPCKKCDSTDGMSCTDCVHKYYLTGNTCTQCPTQCAQCISDTICTKCEDGYYLEGNSCIPCQVPCQTCTGPTFCLTCGYSPDRRVPAPSCACKYEFIAIGNQCTICTHPCKTCDGTTQNDCLTCVVEYWLDGSTCKPCVAPCKTCQGGEDLCLTCIDGYYLHEEGSTKECRECEFPCIFCYAIDQCLTCGYTPARRVDPPSCACKSEYTAVGQDCELCIVPCVTCNSPSATDCKSCEIGDYLDGTQCLPCDNGCISCEGSSSNCSKCEIGYYQDGRNCIQCQFPCIECYGPGLCITCGGAVAQRIGPPLCECKVDQWSDDRELKTCIVCPHPCRRCNSDSVNDCTMCAEEFYLVETTCVPCQLGCKYCSIEPQNCSECAPGYYLDTDGVTCKQCISPCQECTSETFCLVCGYGPTKRISPPLCQCFDTVDSDGKLLGDQGDMCVTCVDPCRHCNGTGPNNCLSCIGGFVHDGEDNSCKTCVSGCIGCTLTYDDYCTSCFDGYFLREDKCLQCHYPCQTCLEQDYCFTCGNDPDNRRNIPPSCQCDYQYHDNGVKCLLCMSPCKTCENEVATDCYSCIDKFYLDGEDGTMAQCLPCGTGCETCKYHADQCYSCENHFYLEGNQCKPCVYPCDTCLNETFCFTCGYDVDNKNPPPTCTCKYGMSDTYWADGETGCIQCSDPCYTCTSTASTDCLSCNEDFYLDGTECKPCYEGCNKCTQTSICQECNAGWYLDGETCIPCQIPCETCINATRCISCVDNLNRYIAPSCVCKDRFYESSDGEGCIACEEPGQVCWNQSTYRTCAPGFYWKSDGEYHNDGEEATWHHPLITGSCLPCQNPCETCLNDTWCYTCTSAANRGEPPECICEIGYYNDGESGQCELCVHPIKVCDSIDIARKCWPGWYIEGTECKACQYPCQTCLVLTTCLTCVDNLHRRDVPECTCESGYYDKMNDGTELNRCDPCPSPSTICIDDVQFLVCEDGYYQKADSKTCKPCVYPCEHCVSPVFCTKCGFEPEKRAPPQTCYCLYGQYYQSRPEDEFCTACTEPCDRCLSATHCLSCKDGFTLDGENCISCHDTVGPDCDRCVGTICLSCGLDIEGPNTPSCDCLQETSDSGTYQECFDADRSLCPLLPCVPPCENCVNEKLCTTCFDKDFRYPPEDGENSCKCLPGFKPNLLNKCNKICPSGQFGLRDQCYDCVSPCSECDGEAHMCTDCETGYKYYGNYQCLVQCQFPCATCTGPYDCITCAGLYRDDGENCRCQDGYYEDENKLCQQCQHPCDNCSDVTTCISCMDGEFRQGMEGNCLCESGFSDYEGICIKDCEPGTYVNYDQCIACHPQCKTCEGSGSHCIECNRGYYRNGLTCDRCPNNCLDCNGEGECTECDVSQYGRLDILPTCPCQPGTFERGTTDCGICIDPCVTCETNRINCITCIEGGVNRKAAPDCRCSDGYYDTDGTCEQCGYKCDTCEFQDDYCLTCKSGGIGRNLTAPDCICSPGYFEVGVLHCQQCQYPCATCEGSSTNCLECVFPTEQRYAPNDCNCIDNYYRDNEDHCQNCSWKCKTCRDKANKCIECDGENRVLPTCDCETGYFGIDPNLKCHKCDVKCKKCSGTSDNCDVCRHGPNRKPKPDCTCQDGYYNNEVNICVPCKHPCSFCDDADTCTVCVSDTDPYRYDINSNCQCHIGYFSNGITCQRCHDACISCVGNELNCIEENPSYVSGGCAPQCQICAHGRENCVKCSSGAYRINDAIKGCPCKEGYYGQENTADCLACLSVCESCFNGSQCTTCKNPILQAPYCKFEKGKMAEVQTNDGQVAFEQCSPQCDTCSKQSDNCLTCGKGQYRYDNPPTCDCIQGYHDEGRTQIDCIPCPKECEACSSSKTCLSCKQGLNRVLDLYTMECKCKYGYKSMGDDLKCDKCYDYKEECYLICPENTLQNEQKMICESKNYQFSDNIYLILLTGGIISLIALVLFIGSLNTLQRKYDMNFYNPYSKISQRLAKLKDQI